MSSSARYFTPHRRESTGIGNLGSVLEIAGTKRTRRVTIVGVAA